MSNNVAAGAGGYILGMVSLVVEQVQLQSVVEVFTYGIIGGIAGIIGKNIAIWIIRKFKQKFNISTKKDKDGE